MGSLFEVGEGFRPSSNKNVHVRGIAGTGRCIATTEVIAKEDTHANQNVLRHPLDGPMLVHCKLRIKSNSKTSFVVQHTQSSFSLDKI